MEGILKRLAIGAIAGVCFVVGFFGINQGRPRSPREGIQPTTGFLRGASADRGGPASREDARAATQRLLTPITSTGFSAEGWTRSAQKVLQNWVAKRTPSPKVSFSDVGCYRGGCVIKATYGDSVAFMDMDLNFVGSEEFNGWPGAKMRTPPVTEADGTISANWVLLPPQ